MSTSRLLGTLGASSGFLGIAAGPLGAHHLRLAPDMLEVFQTAARYQITHALALVLVALALESGSSRWLGGAGWLFVAGQLFFPFGLYAFALTGRHGWSAVTPVGGLCYLAGWVALMIAFARRGTR